MSIVVANSTKALLSVLKSAQSGDTILLEAGNYSGVNVKGLKFDGVVTIASKDPNDPAVLTGLSISGSEGLKFSNLEFDLSSPHTVWNLSIVNSKNIELNGLDIHGSLNDNPGDDRSAVLVRGSSDVRVLNSEFQQLDHGISMVASNGVRLEGNAFHDIRADGVIGSGSSNVQVVDNTFTDFHPVDGDHPDAIQFFTRNTTASAHDITISGNLIARGDGAIIQGIFVTDQVGNLPYQDLVITNNVLVGTMYNGIAVQNSENLLLSGNTVAAYSDMKSWIYVNKSTGATVTDNEAMLVKYALATDLTQSGNVVTPRVTVDQTQIVITGDPDRFEGAAGNEILIGSSGSDWLYGRHGDDALSGGEGRDWLEGGAGSDVLNGGAGGDRFSFGPDVVAPGEVPAADWSSEIWWADFDYYEAVSAPSVPVTTDRIEDFSSAENDRIVVSAIDANSQTAADDRFSFIGTQAFSHRAGELRYEVVAGDAHVKGDVDGDGVADFEIQVAGVNVLAASAFIL
jgi:Ca2+-binding RTX toxin-like protein